MLIAASAFAGLLASAVLPVNLSPPPTVITVTAAPDVPASVVKAALAEVDAIFRGAGITFAWRHGDSPFAALRVVITNETVPARGTATALGWIKFEDGRPGETVYVSYTNAVRYLEASRPVVGLSASMTVFEREQLLSRATGRALAHELGHYLLATKAHTKSGLLKAARTSYEFFAPDRSKFAIDPAQRIQMVSRLLGEPVIASR